MKKSLFSFFLFSLISISVHATDYTVTVGEAYTTYNTNFWYSYALPLYTTGSTTASGSLCSYSSISQQIYLKSELGASAKNIKGITFYAGGRGNTSDVSSSNNRKIEIWILETDADAFVMDTKAESATKWLYAFQCDASTGLPGRRVYSGTLATPTLKSGEVKEFSITFNEEFEWSGEKNILLTFVDSTKNADIADKLLRWQIIKTDNPRYVHKQWTSSNQTGITRGLSGKYGDAYPGTFSESNQTTQHKYVPKTKFTYSIPTTPISVPENLAASSITTSSATLSWDAVDGADSYNVRWGKTSGSLDNSDNVATNSIDIDGLDDGETYYFDVQTVKGAGTSAYASEASFNTTAVTHIHDGITFTKWSSTSSLPASGNYYLANDVAYDSDVTLTGDLNLCLNGHVVNIYTNKIVVPDGKTLAIYDNVGGGKITGVVPGEVGAADIYAKALIVVYGGGELDLHQGTIENNFEHDPTDPEEHFSSYAIYSNGTLHLSGDVLINSHDADIYLYSTNKITLDGALSNAEKHTVFKNDGKFTIGWSTYMSAADPRDYFESANSGKSVCLSEGEAALRTLLHLSEESQNSGITTNYNQKVDVELTRSLTSAQYNTFCLPFALSAVQMAEFFGAGYDLEELTSSLLEEEILTLTFERKYELEAGKPYLLQPSIEVVNPSFEGVTITANMPDTIETTYADLRAIYRPTELAGDNHNLLFLGEDNTLFWPESTGNINGFRAYFVVKGAAANAVQARIGRAESQTTAIDNQKSHIDNHKYMKDGQLFIERNGVIYNAQGQTIK